MILYPLLVIFIMSPLFISAQPPTESRVDQIITSSLDFWKAPGCAVAIVRNNEAVLTKGYGENIDVHTVFPIASLTKLITALSVGMLVDRRAVEWDTPIVTFYPELTLSDEYAKTRLTLRDCLAMRSGLPGPSADSFIYSSPLTTQALLSEKLPKLPFEKGFRSHFAYQNLLYLLAVKPFASWVDFLKKEMLAPVGMQETLASFSEFQNSTHKPALYQWKTNRFSEVAPENLENIVSAAGLYSSAHDMSLFLRSIAKFVSAGTLQEIFTAQTTVSAAHFLGPEDLFVQDILFPDSNFLEYGLGCFIHEYRGMKIIQVPGLTNGATPVLAFLPALDLSICVLINAESAAVSRAILFQLIDAHIGISSNWNERFLRVITSKD